MGNCIEDAISSVFIGDHLWLQMPLPGSVNGKRLTSL
jgi:hypothetical protein